MPDAGVDQSDDGPAWVVSLSGLCRTVRLVVPCGTWCVGHCAHFGRARFASAPRPDTPRALGVVFTPVVGVTPIPLSLSHLAARARCLSLARRLSLPLSLSLSLFVRSCSASVRSALSLSLARSLLLSSSLAHVLSLSRRAVTRARDRLVCI